jgi:hypothetical protein
MCLIDWVVCNDDYSLVGCLVGLLVLCLVGGCEAVLVRKRPRDCG